jgi:hypothetical protein
MDGGGKPSGLAIALGPTPYTKEAIMNLKESVRQSVLRDLVAYLNALDARAACRLSQLDESAPQTATEAGSKIASV